MNNNTKGKNQNNPSTKGGEEFNSLAAKLRKEKFDREEIKKIKNETIVHHKLKNRRKKGAQTIQKVFRGYRFRKRFQSIIEEVNTKTIIEYLREKRKQRIQSNAQKIILSSISDYLAYKRSIKISMMIKYMHYCSTLIRSTYKSYLVRKKIEPVISLFRERKEKISGLVNSFKIRMILRSKKLQDILEEIANIKCLLNSLRMDERTSDKSEKLKMEFKKRLPRLKKHFYSEFYKTKVNHLFLNSFRTEKAWMEKYMTIIKSLIKNIFAENPNNVLNKSYSDNGSKFYTVNNTQTENIGNFNDTHSQIIKQSEDPPTVTNNKNPKANPPISNPWTDYENKPIRVNPKKIYDLSKIPDAYVYDDNSKPNEDTSQPKRKSRSPLKRKQPKYDARKAIEEAKLKDGKKEKEKTSTFREFIREMKGNSEKKKAEQEKITKENNNEQVAQASASCGSGGFRLTFSQKENRSKSKKKENQIEESAKEGPKENNRRAKIVTQGMEMRKRLHELEKSPPPRIDLKSIKSKVECWGPKGTETLNIKKVKKGDIEDSKGFSPFEKKLNLEFFQQLDKEYAYISSSYNLNDYLGLKSEKMKTSPKIPFIKPDSFYIKHYSNDIYEQLLVHLNKHYDELKN